jgi:hypothetical protein
VSLLMVGLLLFTPFISTSPLWTSLGGTSVVTLALILGATGWLIIVEGRGLWTYQVVLGSVLLATAAIPAIYWADPRLMAFPLFLAVALLLVGLARSDEVSVMVDVSSVLMLVLVVGAVVGFALAQAGIAPIAEIINRDGRPNRFFYTTFANIQVGNFIRPAGIYDEPGAFSFFICAVAYLRLATGKRDGPTLALLVLGHITFSLAHVVFSLVMGLALFWHRQFSKLVIWGGVAVAAVYMAGMVQFFDRYLFARMTLDSAVSGGFAGGRFVLFNNALSAIQTHAHALWVGLHPDCTFDVVRCNQIAGYIAENPLGPMAAQGVFLAWPYYVFLLAALLAPLSGRRGVALAALGLLFLQRPYVSSHGYSVIAMLAIWIHFGWLGRGGVARTSSDRQGRVVVEVVP